MAQVRNEFWLKYIQQYLHPERCGGGERRLTWWKPCKLHIFPWFKTVYLESSRKKIWKSTIQKMFFFWKKNRAVFLAVTSLTQTSHKPSINGKRHLRNFAGSTWFLANGRVESKVVITNTLSIRVDPIDVVFGPSVNDFVFFSKVKLFCGVIFLRESISARPRWWARREKYVWNIHEHYTPEN